MPVRERLLLVLPEKEIYDYLCTGCAGSVGQREVTSAEKLMSATAAGGGGGGPAGGRAPARAGAFVAAAALREPASSNR